MKIVYPKEEACMACRLCEVACITEHSKSKDTLKAYKNENPAPLSRTLVEEIFPGLSVSVMCRHCSYAPCIEACFTSAMHRKPDGRVIVNEPKCGVLDVHNGMSIWCNKKKPVYRRGARGKGQGARNKDKAVFQVRPLS